MSVRSEFPKLLFSLVSGTFVLFCLYILLDRVAWQSDQKLLTQWMHQLNAPPVKPENEFVFVNVQYDKVTFKRAREGNEVITDRRLLTYFLRFLHEHKNDYKFLICDLYFSVPADQTLNQWDKALANEFAKIKRNFIVAGVLNDDETDLSQQIFPKLPLGLVTVVPTGNSLYKWQLKQKGIKTLPLKMYEQLDRKKVSPLHFNNIPLTFYFNNESLLNAPHYFGSLEDFEAFGDLPEAIREEVYGTIFKASFKDKIIILGDFSQSDMHKTIIGDMYGSLLLVNTYLSLQAGNANIPLIGFIALLIVFTVLSYRALYVVEIKLPYQLLFFARFPLVRFFDYFWLALILSFISYFLLGFHLSVIFIFLYFKTIRYIKLGGKLRQLEKDILIEKQKNDALLLNIMPRDVAEELKATGKTKIRKFDSATVLFADVKGFSKKAKELQETRPQTASEDLITLLDTTFSKMDKLCKKYQLERVKTIGDCYMAVAGVPVANTTHILDTALVALQIQQWMHKEREERKGDFWQVRLGFHSGELVAGVIGTQRFAYDVWGADVNIASRMESGGEVGKVNTTEHCKNMLEEFFEFEYRGEIEAKNIGKVKAYFLNRIKPALSEDVEGFVPNAKFAELKQKVFGV